MARYHPDSLLTLAANAVIKKYKKKLPTDKEIAEIRMLCK